MDPQFETNMATWYVIIPILIIALAFLVWFIIKMKISVWKQVALIVISLFAFFGFTTGVLAVYYNVNEPFSAMFMFYA